MTCRLVDALDNTVAFFYTPSKQIKLIQGEGCFTESTQQKPFENVFSQVLLLEPRA